MAKFSTGFMLRREIPPEDIITSVKQIEDAGFDECWMVEDCFYYSGVASTAVALAETSQIRIGLGLMPAVARNAAFTAMEIATLARIYPGRLLPAIGHGVTEWMKQIGAFPASQLAALEETTTTVRRLLGGESVSFEGQHVNLDNVLLEYPPEVVPPLYLGVRGPKSLQLSGRVAEGTILAEYSAPAYISWARQQIAQGQVQAGHAGEHHHITLYVLTLLDSPHGKALDLLRPIVANELSSGNWEAHLNPLPIADEIAALIQQGGKSALERDMPDAWINQFAIAGSPEDCAETVEELVKAGADSIVFVPLPGREPETLAQVRNQLLPLLDI